MMSHYYILITTETTTAAPVAEYNGYKQHMPFGPYHKSEVAKHKVFTGNSRKNGCENDDGDEREKNE